MELERGCREEERGGRGLVVMVRHLMVRFGFKLFKTFGQCFVGFDSKKREKISVL